ncbi:MAG: 16S rRNA (cytosine(1402)-N(4))-methyltransferase RsmH [Muribaculaceae bacterium]|nr:16S rRNA (cytosine(1402)-N(4))-methyltransferase RsmH [Muribaculaceae bacterium]
MASTDTSTLPYHIPALLPEAIDLLGIKPGGIYIDATFGGGGHSRAILEGLGPEGRLFSFDRDPDAYENRIEDPRFTFVHGNFRYLENFMRYYGVDKVDGILADFGVSFHHFDTAERGFSFRAEAPLDMRMNRNAAMTAERLIAQSSEEEILSMLRSYADLKKPGAVAKAITAAKEGAGIQTTTQLTEAVLKALDPRQEKKELAQVFQAFRIAVNNEADDLQTFLNSAQKVLMDGGRLVTLTYHSMEDRMVKNFMKTGNIEGLEDKDFFGHVKTPWRVLTRRPIEAGDEEVGRNPRARSARLRAAEKIETGKS